MKRQIMYRKTYKLITLRFTLSITLTSILNVSMFSIEPAAVNNGFSILLKNRNFMLLWIGQIISQLGDKIFFVLMIALLENNQNEDGSVNIPPILRKYMNNQDKI